jgi:Protein of unknown function (DUF1499)
MNAPNAWPARLLGIARYAALASAALLLVAGPGHRLRLLPFDFAFKGPFLIGVLAAFVAFVLAGSALFASSTGRGEPKAWRNWLAFVFGAFVVIAAAHWYGQLRSASLLHDVTTDTVHPPPFVETVARRAADHATNTVDYVAEYSVDGAAVNAPELQKELYPDLRQILLRAKKPAEGFVLAEKAARAMGWKIVAVVAGEGRIEATSTSLFFGLKDDIAIRVRSEQLGRGSVVDVRSASRLGANDGGANARNIREFTDRLKTMN